LAGLAGFCTAYLNIAFALCPPMTYGWGGQKDGVLNGRLFHGPHCQAFIHHPGNRHVQSRIITSTQDS